MHHLSSERLVALAEGSPARPNERAHLAECPVCAREVNEIAGIMAAVGAREDRPLPTERLQRNAQRIARRIEESRPRAGKVGMRPWATLIPLAAAAVIALVPRLQDTPWQWEASAGGTETQADLSANEFDVLVSGLARSSDELGIVQQVLDRQHSPLREIAEMSGAELENLLDLMEINGSG
ncbi:MAG: hypothetical protein MUE60_03420 [Candidatus Eisenbacteria bacterium]|jgi:hypothetical protein|nr:hypothetical protein [Candidatus Eisenbacteria bacterium]